MTARIIGVVLAMLALSTGLQAENNPFLGKWKEDAAKSKYNNGISAGDSLIFTYAMVAGDAIKLTVESRRGVNVQNVVKVYKFGTPYQYGYEQGPIIRSSVPDYRSRTYIPKRIDANTIQYI